MQSTDGFNILGAFAAHRPLPAAPLDLHGVWHCDDGGLYYLRQIGADIMWYGENAPGQHSFASVAHGHLDGRRLHMSWADVPKGPGHACGALTILVEDAGRMVATRSSGGFGGTVWTR